MICPCCGRDGADTATIVHNAYLMRQGRDRVRSDSRSVAEIIARFAPKKCPENAHQSVPGRVSWTIRGAA